MINKWWRDGILATLMIVSLLSGNMLIFGAAILLGIAFYVAQRTRRGS